MSSERVSESETADSGAVGAPAVGTQGPGVGNRAFAALVERGEWQLAAAPARYQIAAVLARQRSRRRVLARQPSREELIDATNKEIADARAGASTWKAVAIRLNGFNTADVTRMTAGLTKDELIAVRGAAERELRDSGWPIQHLLDGIDATGATKGAKLRPQGSSIWAAYDGIKYNPNPPGSGPWSGLSGAEVWDTIGGTIGQGFGPNSNSCAARVSFAFNYGGYPINERDTGWIYYNDPKVTYDKPVPESVKKKAGDGKRYIVSAPYMETYLAKKWGPRDANLKTNDEAKSFALGLGVNQVAIFAGVHHVGVIRKYTTDGYKDAYLFTDPGVMPASAWILP